MAEEAGGSSRRKTGPVAVVTAVIAFVVLLFFLGRETAAAIPRFAEWVEGLGPSGPAMFVLGYVVATVAFVPGSLLTLAAGAVFGLLWGTIWVFIGATAGATLAFLVSRYVARRTVEKRLAGNARFAAIDRAIGESGLRIALLLRLSPAFPFNLLNYALGLTRIRLRDYVIASAGMLPGTLLYVYYGKLAGDVAALAAGVRPERGTAYYVVMALGLIATVAVTAAVTGAARRALREVTA